MHERLIRRAAASYAHALKNIAPGSARFLLHFTHLPAPSLFLQTNFVVRDPPAITDTLAMAERPSALMSLTHTTSPARRQQATALDPPASA
ncbi:hypothetical protein ACFU7D_23890 [Nocardioides sp. NPDC057577]|uniref:hypothetical protein n=1 Tax=Nocardioides sp. NPDC057577 TaxID=3346171 RepID=UPI00366AF1EA